MQETAGAIQEPLHPFFSARITGRTDHFFHIQAEGVQCIAFQASSCLLEPEQGDRVLVFSEGEERFILAILARESSPSPRNRVTFHGPTQLRVRGGGCILSSEEDVRLAAAGNLGLTSERLQVDSHRAEANIDDCSLWGRMLRIQVETVRSVFKVVDSLVKRWTMKTENATRYISEHEEVQAGSARYLTQETLTVHSKDAAHTAEDLFSVNGGQINLS